MLRALALAALLLAGCASAPAPHASTSTATATVSATASMPAPAKPTLPPPPQVGTCDLAVTSGGTTNGAIRNGGCSLASAISGLSPDARSLLVEVTWDSLPATVLALHTSLENPAACGSQAFLGGGCSELATNNSMAPPVRVTLDGDSFAKFGAASTAYENVYEGAAVQQTFHFTFSAFQQEHVPGNYTALK